MTFTEAAVEVLRSAGKPLHYKKITEIAIEKNLLSHVGKTPETTMSSRLATMVKKDRGDAPILKVKPGVFALREFPEEAIEEAGGDTSDSDAPEASEPKA
ncbi:MAG: winged helix-turn-helix domain-containing protein, partial [Polyangiales bacterium]